MARARLSVGFALLALLTFGASLVSATVSVEVDADFRCDRVRVKYDLSGNLPNLAFRVYDGSDNALSDVVEGPWEAGDNLRVSIRLKEEQPEGTLLVVKYSTGGDFFYPLGDYSGKCSLDGDDDDDAEAGAPLPEPPYRLGGENARLKVYVVDDNGPQNPVLAFYRVNEDATGTLIFYISAMQLAADYPDVPATPTLIFSEGPYSFYKLPSGEFQVNAGPDAEGKTDVLIFTGVPPADVRRDQYNIYDVLGWLPLSLRERINL